MTIINKLNLERLNITPSGLRPKTRTQLIEALNSTSYQLDWLAQMLGFSNQLYWDDLNLSIFEKRRILLNALSCDPEVRFPFTKDVINDFRIINVTFQEPNQLVLLDRVMPTLHLYGGITYIFNVEQYPTFDITNVKFGGSIPKDDPDQLLHVIDRRSDGYIIAIPNKNISELTETSYFGFDIATNIRETTWGLIQLRPERNISDWKAIRKTVRKDITLDQWEDNGITWYGSTTYDTIPLYPEYNRTDSPPDGFVYVNQRPSLNMEEDYASAQIFRYDNEFFRDQGFPELQYRPSVFYDFFGIHGSKGAAFSFNFMVDALNYKGFNDKTLNVDSIQTTYSNTTGEYEEGKAYTKGQVFVFNHNDHADVFQNYLIQSWYVVKYDYTSVNITQDLRDGNAEPVSSPRKTIWSMRKDTRNDIIPLRLWIQRDLQVADETNLSLYENQLIAGVGYTNGKEVGIYHIRLPLEYERNGVAWQRITLVAKTYLYFGDEDPETLTTGEKIRHQDYRIGYAYFAAGFSAADEAVFNPQESPVQFSPLDPRQSLYLKNKW